MKNRSDEALHILIIEDLPTDAELCEREVRKSLSHCVFMRVETREDFLAALDSFQPALIISDYKMPRFDGMTALTLALEHVPGTPFIVLTGSMNEETAVTCMKAGAWDYVIKEHIRRLGPAVISALEQKEVRRQRREAEEALDRSEMLFRKLFEEHAAVKMILDPDTGHIIDVNEAAVDFYGWSRTQMKTMKIQDINTLSPEEVTKEMEKVRTAKRVHFEFRHRRADGSIRDVEVFSSKIEVNGRDFLHSVIHDITDRKEIEAALRENEEKYRTILDSIEHGYWEVDLNGTFTFCNNAMFKITGTSPDQLIGMGFRDYSTPRTQERLYRVFNQVYRTGEPAESIDHEATLNDGRKLIFELSVSLMKDKNGTSIGFRGITRDVTARKEMEEQIRQSEERYRMIVERMSDIIWMTDMDLRTTFVTPSILTVLGFTPEERMLQPIEDQLTPDSLSYALNLLAEELAAEETGGVDPNRTRTLELEYYHKSGSTRWMETIISGMRDDQGTLIGLLGVFRDITDRKNAELDLHETLERLRQSVAATIQVMVSAVEIRDPYTAGHQARVSHLAASVAGEMGFDEARIEGMRVAGLIHDIGKLSVPAEILSKPTTLTPIEFSLIKDHARSGYEILKNVETDWPLAEIVHQHHERMDGSGYPRGLKGDNILIEARILAVADVVESIASHRPWRPAFDIEAVLAEIEGNRGTLYDDKAVDACLTLFRKKGYRLP